MKVIFFLIVFSFSAFAEISLINPPKHNLEVRMGELTGAGGKFSLKTVAGFVYKDKYIMKEDCKNIILKKTIDPIVSDIVSLEVGEQTIFPNQLDGIILDH